MEPSVAPARCLSRSQLAKGLASSEEGVAPNPGGITSTVGDFASSARKTGATLIHEQHESAGADAPIFAKGSQNVGFIPAVAPREGEKVVVKQYPNAFRDTDLKAALDAAGVREVVVIGAMSHMCIDASRAAFDLGYTVTVVHDACATRDLEFGNRTVAAAEVQTAFLSALAFVYAKVVSTSEFLGA